MQPYLPLLQCTPPSSTQTYTAERDDEPNLHLGNLKKINSAQKRCTWNRLVSVQPQ